MVGTQRFSRTVERRRPSGSGGSIEAIVLACLYCDLTTYLPRSWSALQLAGYE